MTTEQVIDVLVKSYKSSDTFRQIRRKIAVIYRQVRNLIIQLIKCPSKMETIVSSYD